MPRISKCSLDGCRNLPFRREGDTGLTGASSKKGKCAESPPTFICGKRWKNRRKPVMKNIPDSGVVFTFEEGISTSHVFPKGQQPLIKCANMTSKCFIFPFLCVFVFLCFLCFLYFFIVLWSTRVFPSLLVSSIAMRKSYIRSSFKTKCWLSCVDLFPQD